MSLDASVSSSASVLNMFVMILLVPPFPLSSVSLFPSAHVNCLSVVVIIPSSCISLLHITVPSSLSSSLLLRLLLPSVSLFPLRHVNSLSVRHYPLVLHLTPSHPFPFLPFFISLMLPSLLLFPSTHDNSLSLLVIIPSPCISLLHIPFPSSLSSSLSCFSLISSFY